YMQAHLMDPADPTPLRYLGENYRHNIGAWDKAREVFNQILDMPADPLSRSHSLIATWRSIGIRKTIQSRATSTPRRRSLSIRKILTTLSLPPSSWPR